MTNYKNTYNILDLEETSLYDLYLENQELMEDVIANLEQENIV